MPGLTWPSISKGFSQGRWTRASRRRV